MIKDCFSGKRRETILAVTQTMSGLAPMLAPVIGVFIIQLFGWRGSFWTLVLISVVNLLLTLLYQETLPPAERSRGSFFHSMSGLGIVARNKSFFFPAIIFSLSAFPFMGYIAVSSYIYVDYFGLSEQLYSWFFAANALVSIAGPTIYVRFLGGMDKQALASGAFILGIVSGLLVMTVGRLSPLAFWLSFVIMALTGAAIRPFSTNLLFNQQPGNAGAAASLMSLLFTVLGSAGMLMASLPWGNIVTGLGALILLFSAVALVCWRLFVNSAIPCAGLRKQ